MSMNKQKQFEPIVDPLLIAALNELSRSINVTSTYGSDHPALKAAMAKTERVMNDLFKTRQKVLIGAFNGMLTVDEVPVQAVGTLLKALERRLAQLMITGIKLSRGLHEGELKQLCTLLALKESSEFKSGLNASKMRFVKSEETRFEAVREGQTVADETDVSGMGGTGVLVLDDATYVPPGAPDSEPAFTEAGGDVHVEQIVAFLKGDVESDEEVSNELAELASDPARLGKLIMESVSVRQAVSELSGESLGDIVLGCLRRTFKGLRQNPAFQSPEGMVDLRKALLMLEENLLERMRALTGDAAPEIDREIVQAIREMDETLGFEIAAASYVRNKDALEKNKDRIRSFIESNGSEAARELLADSDFPQREWRRIVVESGKASDSGSPPIAAGLNALTTVFERLENLMRSSDGEGSEQVRDLIGEANENIDDTIYTTKEKLEVLSKQLKDEDGTIGGQGKNMNQSELLAALSEVAQELMQPLTAINASLEMLSQGYAGDVTSDQRDILTLASNSGEHLNFLMKELIDIVGCPTNKGVDSRFHTTSEEVIQHQKEAEGQEHLPFNFFK